MSDTLTPTHPSKRSPLAFQPASAAVRDLQAASVNVVVGTASFTVLGALTGSTMGVVTNRPAIPLAFSTAVNTGLFSFGFFSLREYVITPFLLPAFASSFSDPAATTSPHLHNLAPTFLAGLPAGIAFSYLARGSPGAVRGGATLALGCTAVQSIVNELSLIRIKALAWSEDRSPYREDASAPDPHPISEMNPATHHFHNPKSETFSERSDRLIGGGWHWVKAKVGALSPVTKMDAGEYRQVLATRLGEIEQQLGEVKKEREAVELEERRR